MTLFHMICRLGSPLDVAKPGSPGKTWQQIKILESLAAGSPGKAGQSWQGLAGLAALARPGAAKDSRVFSRWQPWQGLAALARPGNPGKAWQPMLD